jgi:hypothetical protein
MERPTRVRKQPSRLADFELGEDSGKLVRGGNGHVGRDGRGGRGRKVGGVVRGGRGVSREPGSFSCSSVVCMGAETVEVGAKTIKISAETIEIGAETVKFGAEMDNIFS